MSVPSPSPTPAPLAAIGPFVIDLSSSVVANTAAIATLLITLVGILVSLLNVRYQIRRQWLLASAQMVTDFEKRFVSREWKEYRTHCGRLLEDHWQGRKTISLSEDFQVIGLFEHIALLVHRRVIDFEMVWSKFGWYYIRYYEGLTAGPVDVIRDIRQREGDPTLWEEFEWFHGKLVKYYRGRNAPLPPGQEPERVKELVAQETALMKYSVSLSHEVSPSPIQSLLKRIRAHR